MVSINKGSKIYPNDYKQYYLYLTGGQAILEYNCADPVILEAVPLWKMKEDVFHVNENNVYVNCKSDCQFVLIRKQECY